MMIFGICRDMKYKNQQLHIEDLDTSLDIDKERNKENENLLPMQYKWLFISF